MNKEDLLQLREIFRTRMDEEDFCIGEEQVEKLFRELLDEPEPEKPTLKQFANEAIKLNELISSNIADKKWKELFERDSFFYKEILKRNK